MERQSIKDKQGREYILIKPFEGFRYEVHRDDRSFNGVGYPFDFNIKAWSEDETALFNYYCPLEYLDDNDYLSDPQNEFKIDKYGNLLRRFKKANELIDFWMDDFVRQDHARLLSSYYPLIDGRKQKERQDEEFDAAVRSRRKTESIDSHYHHLLINTYAYEKNGYERRRIVQCEVMGTKKTEYVECDMRLYTPLSMDLFRLAYPTTVKGVDGKLYSPISTWRYWSVRKLVTLDCLEKDYDLYYPAMFDEVSLWDEYWTESLIEECRQKQYERDSRYEQRRREEEEKRRIEQEAAERQRKADEEKRERDRLFYENLRRTQEETHDILNQAYQNSSKSHDRAFEMWSDTFNDNTRFVDKDGNEHLLRTHDNVAYKRGDTYVTSKEDEGDFLGWEKLKKKY